MEEESKGIVEDTELPSSDQDGVKTDEEELPDVVMNAKAPVNNEEKWMLTMTKQRSVASEHEEGEDTDESLLEEWNGAPEVVRKKRASFTLQEYLDATSVSINYRLAFFCALLPGAILKHV